MLLDMYNILNSTLNVFNIDFLVQPSLHPFHPPGGQRHAPTDNQH